MFAFTGTTVLGSTSFTSGLGAAVCAERRLPAVSQRRQTPRAQLIGIPDNLRGNIEPSPHEVLLAELRYSDPARLPALVESSIPQLDEEFYNFLEQAINESSDLEERETLRALRDAITSIMQQILDQVAKEQEEAAQKSSAAAPTTATSEAQKSFDDLIDLLMESFNEDDPAAIKSAVDIHYHRIDISFLERLSERIVSAGDAAPRLSQLRNTINDVMNERVRQAMAVVKEVLSAGAPSDMKLAVDRLTKQGKIDDAFVLLLQANVEAATDAGATDAVGVLKEIAEYAMDRKDMEVEPEIRLIRKLLRTENEGDRAVMLTQSFEAGAPVALTDGTTKISTKVDGKKFVAALRRLIQEFGHVDPQFVLKLSKIGEESEAVARKIYDMEDKTVQEVQDEAFHKRSVSIWDLEEFEQQETAEGRVAPWEGKLGSIPEKMGFGPDGKLSV